MKKLSLLIALALLITVGGVYATWSYAENTAVASSTIAPQVKLLGTTNTTKGTITIEGSPSVAFDQYGVNDYRAKLVWTNEVVTVKFNPAQGTTATKIDVDITVVLPTQPFSTSDGNYLVFKHKDSNDQTFKIRVNDVDATTGKTFNLSDHITTELKLPTLPDYNAFAAAMSGYPISVSAAEAAPAN